MGRMARRIAQWWDPQPLPGGREAGAVGEEATWGQMAKGHECQPEWAQAPSLLLGEAFLAWTAVGQAGGWDVTGPRQWWRWACGKPLRGEPQALRGDGDMEHGALTLCAEASGDLPALGWAWRETQQCFKRRWVAWGGPSESSV